MIIRKRLKTLYIVEDNVHSGLLRYKLKCVYTQGFTVTIRCMGSRH